MAFDELLAARVRKALARRGNTGEKRMFGGIGFFLNGNMLCGVRKDSVILRLGQEEAERALVELHVTVFNIGGRVMKGWVVVAAKAMAQDKQLRGWLQLAIGFVRKLPGK